MNLLIDENLSPTLVQKLAEKGIPAQAVVHSGLEGTTDQAVFEFAYEHDQAVVTINASDFLTLARSVELHPGLIVLRSHGLSRDEQWAWLEPVVTSLMASKTSLVNKAIEVTGVGQFVTRSLPGPTS